MTTKAEVREAEDYAKRQREALAARPAHRCRFEPEGICAACGAGPREPCPDNKRSRS